MSDIKLSQAIAECPADAYDFTIEQSFAQMKQIALILSEACERVASCDVPTDDIRLLTHESMILVARHALTKCREMLEK